MTLIQDFTHKIDVMRKRARDKNKFLAGIITAAEDGFLTDEMIKSIDIHRQELELTSDDLKPVRSRAYKAAVRAVISDGIVTEAEQDELANIQRVLNIPDDEIRQEKKEIARLLLIKEIKSGNIPSIPIAGVILQKNEHAYWIEPASLLEERVVGRHYEGGSHGLRLRIAKGVSYRVGSHKGKLITDKEVMPVSFGDLIVTNKRVIFRGNTKSFNLRIDKILEMEFYSNGMRVTDDRGKPRLIAFSNEESIELVGVIISYAINEMLSGK